MHSILSRQLRKAGLDAELPPSAEQWSRFLELVSRSYTQADQDRYTVERSLEISSNEMQELNGSLRRSSAALKTESNRLGAVITSLTSGLAVIDDQGRVTMVNPAALRLGKCASEDVRGRPLSDLFRIHIGGLDREETEDVTDTVARGGAFQNREGRLVQRDGSCVPISFSLLRINREGAATEAVLVVRDITEDKQGEEELIRARDAAETANRTKSEFLANMSHEIRTPMNGVIGMTDLLLQTGLSDVQRDYATMVRDSARNLLVIVNDVLDFSKIEAGKLVIEPVDVEFLPFVDDTMALLREPAHRKQLELIVDHADDLPATIVADPVRLRQILINLVSNAVKFTEAGHVTLRVSCQRSGLLGGGIRFEVQDSGIGIEPSALPRLFAQFSQADGSTTRRFGGTGLGLALCKRFVELMNGQIGVESVPGTGSTFWFTLPMVIGDSPVRAEGGRPVLLVADRTPARLAFERQLSRAGIGVSIVSSVQQALAHLRTAAAEGAILPAVLVDITTVKGEADRLVHAVRTDVRLKSASLVALTTCVQQIAAGPAGFDLSLVKPVRGADLHAALRTAPQETRPVARSTQPPAAGAALPPDNDATRSPGAARLVILLAEDNIVNQRIAQAQLTKLGFLVDTCGNGREALEAFSRKHYDLVLMDCQMPAMDGFEATASIRRLEPAGRRIPIVALTANAMQGDRERCVSAGMDDYVTKPTHMDELGRVIGRWTHEIAPGATVESNAVHER